MPSLPASDGFQNPVQSSGLNSKICNPTNQLLDHSVSAPASVCSSESSLAEPIDPGAIKTFDSSLEHQITPEKEHSLVLQHRSSSSSLANNDPSPHTRDGTGTCSNPACLSQKTLKKTFIADILKECNTKGQDHGQEHPLEVTKVKLADTAAKHGRDKNVCLSAEQEQKPELSTDHRTYKEPEKEHLEQTETTDPEPPCCVSEAEKPAVAEAKQLENPPMEMRDGLERAGLSCVKGSIQLLASCSQVHMEASMETDAVEQAAAELQSSAREQKQKTENRCVSSLNSDAFSMEVELLKSPSSLTDPLSTVDVLESESTGEIPAKYKLANLAADSSPPSSIHQLDTDPGRPSEEPCFPLASALKELHKLLVISRKDKILGSEEVSQLEIVQREPAVQQKGLPEGEQKGLDPASQEQSCSFSGVRCEDGGAEGSQRCDGVREHISTGPVSPGQPVLEEGALEREKGSGKGNVVVVSSAATAGQQSPEQGEVLAGGSQSPSSPTLEQSTPVSSTSASSEGVPQNARSLFTGAPGRSDTAAPEGPWLVGGSEEPPLSPAAAYTRLSTGASAPPAFPAADVDRILSAGFTPQEALEALEQADGNADLALLILLAKSIIVPT
uniref:Regulator of solute carriers 1 n=1 Tax=Malurus cyaneus samueli TaxID=2593467 RepID=A0A8C5X6U4_9PASS